MLFGFRKVAQRLPIVSFKRFREGGHIGVARGARQRGKVAPARLYIFQRELHSGGEHRFCDCFAEGRQKKLVGNLRRSLEPFCRDKPVPFFGGRRFYAACHAHNGGVLPRVFAHAEFAQKQLRKYVGKLFENRNAASRAVNFVEIEILRAAETDSKISGRKTLG